MKLVIYFEKSCSKKVSGVFATEANYFIYILPRYKENNFYIVKPEKLIELLKSPLLYKLWWR
jgi:hypothetical protein